MFMIRVDDGRDLQVRLCLTGGDENFLPSVRQETKALRGGAKAIRGFISLDVWGLNRGKAQLPDLAFPLAKAQRP